MYETFAHTADMGLRVQSRDLNSLYADAARGLFSMLVENLDQVRPVQQKVYQIAGDEQDYLLLDWLNELLFTFDTERLLLAQFDVHVQPPGLSATCHGEPLDARRHRMDHEIKAITYHGLKVEQAGDGWLAEVIVDI